MIVAQVVGGKVPSCVYCGTSAIGPVTGVTTYTFTGVSTSTAKSTRYFVVGLTTISPAIVSVTVDGISCTQLVNPQPNPGPFFVRTEFWGVALPVGTSSTVVVTISSSTNVRVGATFWSLYGLRSNTPYATVTTASLPATLDITGQARGIVLGLAGNSQVSGTFTWTGATQDYQTDQATNIMTRTGAHLTIAPGVNPVPLSLAFSASPSQWAISAAWR